MTSPPWHDCFATATCPTLPLLRLLLPLTGSASGYAKSTIITTAYPALPLLRLRLLLLPLTCTHYGGRRRGVCPPGVCSDPATGPLAAACAHARAPGTPLLSLPLPPAPATCLWSPTAINRRNHQPQQQPQPSTNKARDLPTGATLIARGVRGGVRSGGVQGKEVRSGGVRSGGVRSGGVRSGARFKNPKTLKP